MALQFTAASLGGAIAVLGSKSFSDGLAALQTAFADRFADPKADAIAIEEILDTLSGVPGLADLKYGEDAIKLLVVAATLMQAQPGGGVIGALFTSFSGVQATVDNADGSQF